MVWRHKAFWGLPGSRSTCAIRLLWQVLSLPARVRQLGLVSDGQLMGWLPAALGPFQLGAKAE